MTVPDVPAGTSQPCCQPLTGTGVSVIPVSVVAVHPGLMLSGTTITRATGDGGTRSSR